MGVSIWYHLGFVASGRPGSLRSDPFQFQIGIVRVGKQCMRSDVGLSDDSREGRTSKMSRSMLARSCIILAGSRCSRDHQLDRSFRGCREGKRTLRLPSGNNHGGIYRTWCSFRGIRNACQAHTYGISFVQICLRKIPVYTMCTWFGLGCSGESRGGKTSKMSRSMQTRSCKILAGSRCSRDHQLDRSFRECRRGRMDSNMLSDSIQMGIYRT